jgi:4-hydroxy-3-polyprenylbenzoate decarboxylase
MLRLAHAGARILPASPGFYHRPQTIEELVDHLVFRILDQLGVPHSQATRWKGDPTAQEGEPVAVEGD